MQQNYPFQPAATAASTSSIAVTAANQTLTLSPTVGMDGGTMRVTNVGTQTVFMAFGTVTASVTTSMPLPAGTVEAFSLPGGVNTLSVIAAGTGSTLYVTVGSGT